MTERHPMKHPWDKELVDWTDDEIVELLRNRYRSTTILPCRVCGGKLSVQAVGGGRPTVYACIEGEGRKLPDDHYSKSTFEDYKQGGDDVVIEAVRRWKGSPS